MALVGIVVVSHSRTLAEAAVELSLQMVHGDRPEIVIAAGTSDGGLGTDATKVAEAITSADQGAGVLILMDLGSAVLSAEFALDLVEGSGIETQLVPAPFLEGLLAAVVRAAGGASLDEVAFEANAAMAPKLLALGFDEPLPTGPCSGSEPTPAWDADVQSRAVLPNPLGLHARPAALLVAELGQFDAEVRLRCNGAEASGASVIALATLNARQGDELWVGARGPQATAAVTAAITQIKAGFGEIDHAPEPAQPGATGHPQGVSPGRVVGVARLMPDPVTEPLATRPLTAAQVPAERKRLVAALEAVALGYEERSLHASPEAAGILRATAALARDPELRSAAEALMDSWGVGASVAMWRAATSVAEQLTAAGGVLAERTTDIRDLRDRVVSHLTDRPMPGIPEHPEPFVLVARDLAPSDTATLSEESCLGLVMVNGGPTSHTSILARSMGIPAVMGVADALTIPDGALVLVDGSTGEVVVDPDEQQRNGARTVSVPLEPLRGPGLTADGVAVALLANVDSPGGATKADRAGAEGIGLFRTEISFLNADVEPTLQQQVATYRDVLAPFTGRRVVVRTLDAGSDKSMPFTSLSGEENPALGVRGYRTVAHVPQVLTRQLEAIAEAEALTGAQVWVMAPMISTPAEAEDFAARARAAGLRKVGVMVETPSAALQAAEILTHVDFISIGTNDLTQYTMAADRQAAQLGTLQDPWQPAVLRLLQLAGRAGQAAGKPVGVCGEAASDPGLAPVLVGLGVTSLSMSTRALEPVRQRLAEVTVEQCQALAARAVHADSPESARAAVREA